MNNHQQLFLMAIGLAAVCIPDALAQEQASNSKTQVVLASEVNWEQLNPKRGDASPKAATLWGDRNGTVATGFLVKFVDGFSSPPHIHNVTYRGVVIEGLVHNDDPDAKAMWMPAGAYWTQPAGEVHITAAKGRETVAYIEIEKGPYLVLPTEQAFDRGERPVNIDPSNIIWLDASNTTWIDQNKTFTSNKPEIAFLWGKPQDEHLNGSLVKLPANFKGEIHSHSTLKAVVIAGKTNLQVAGATTPKELSPGSYFSSTEKTTHRVSCGGEAECIIYLRSKGRIKITEQKPSARNPRN